MFLAQYLLLAVKGVIFILMQNPVQLPSVSQALDTNQAGSNSFSRENEENHRKLWKRYVPLLLSSMIFVIEYQESLESKIGLLLSWSLMFLNQMLGPSKMSVRVRTKLSISSSFWKHSLQISIPIHGIWSRVHSNFVKVSHHSSVKRFTNN